ncbi:MAG: isoprenylcysteine carboxylmethyltransferase family protein [Syntrophomonadaceae bacterium]|nr:isoprenylcysteine carboxylmethyltransferase family protein [Syntrophomonadaceae bacterium]MDH7498489.1 isoprenylcysteine carboxylmethyltransferase family protein [Syntrophomonadaceae bacterium]
MEEGKGVSKGRAYLVPVFIMAVLWLLLFLPAGSLRYWAGWVWWTQIGAMTLFITAYFLRRDPRLLARRMQVKEQEPLPAVIRVASQLSMLTFVVPGFDFRWHWSAVPAAAIVAANVVVFAGYLFIFLVFRENSYAATVIRVEEEQPVISTGPYAIVRHPMYLGLLLVMLFTPLALGSYWALLFALLVIPTLVSRIRKEEEVLRRELPGYAAYCARTRYRLLPLVW